MAASLFLRTWGTYQTPLELRALIPKSDLLAGASALLSVRDSVASLFYHPFLGTSHLVDIVREMRRMGYNFVSPCEL